jgi:hypothetical protein
MSRLVKVYRIAEEILREIFDESAYARFLSREGTAVGRTSYAAFLQEQEVVKARRPRCC